MGLPQWNAELGVNGVWLSIEECKKINIELVAASRKNGDHMEYQMGCINRGEESFRLDGFRWVYSGCDDSFGKCGNDLAVYLDSAADNAEQVGNDLALEYLVVAALHTVERLSANGDYSLKLGVSAKLTGGERRISLNYIKLSHARVFGAAVDELFDLVRNVKRARKLSLDADSGLLGALTASLVCKHLI